MDTVLRAALTRLWKQREILADVRATYYLRESERKHFESALQERFDKKTYSHAALVSATLALPEFVEFQRKLALLKAHYEDEELKYEILDKAWQSEYLTFKINAQEMPKHGHS